MKLKIGTRMIINALGPSKQTEGHTLEAIPPAPPVLLEGNSTQKEVEAWYANMRINEQQGQVVCFPAPPCILAPVKES